MDKATAAALLSQALLRKVFDRVVNTRPYILFKDLAQQASKEEIAGALKQLKSAGLIEEHSGPFEDFNKYHASAKGIGVERHLRQFENTLDRF